MTPTRSLAHRWLAPGLPGKGAGFGAPSRSSPVVTAASPHARRASPARIRRAVMPPDRVRDRGRSERPFPGRTRATRRAISGTGSKRAVGSSGLRGHGVPPRQWKGRQMRVGRSFWTSASPEPHFPPGIPVPQR